jgi:acetyltransferase
VDAVLFHAFVGGDEFRPHISSLVEMAERAGKPIFGWVMGKRTEAHKLHTNAKELGLPVFGELYRAVECMAAVLTRTKLPRQGPK